MLADTATALGLYFSVVAMAAAAFVNLWM